MSRTDTLDDAVKTALSDRAGQMRAIAESAEKIRQISEIAETLPETINAAALGMAQTAEAMAKLIDESLAVVRQREEYLRHLDARIDRQIAALAAAADRLERAASRSPQRHRRKKQNT